MHSELLRSPGSLSMVYLLEDKRWKKKKKNPCREWHDIRDDVSKLEKA